MIADNQHTILSEERIMSMDSVDIQQTIDDIVFYTLRDDTNKGV